MLAEVSSSDNVLPLFEDIFSHIDDIRNPGTATTTGPLDFNDVQEHLAKSIVYNYGGSLTTPPCSEGVTWLVAHDRVYIAVNTFEKVKGVMGFNSRYTQNVLGQINLLDNARVELDNGQ